MKATNRNARADISGKHNDRNFDITRAPHIDPSLMQYNKYWTYNGELPDTFVALERQFYSEHFTESLNQRNENNIASGHRGRCVSMDEYRTAKYTRPEDKILQIGDRSKSATPEQLWECALEYQQKFEEMYGEHCKIIDMALHVDEPSHAPHVHVRRVWIATDEQGHEYVGQGKALQQLGIERPDLSAPEGKTNNAKMTITEIDRVMFRDICIEKGLDISKDKPQNKVHLKTAEYAVEKTTEELEKLERQKEILVEEIKNLDHEKNKISSRVESVVNLAEDFLQLDIFNSAYNELIEECKKKALAERAMIVLDIAKKELTNLKKSDGDIEKAEKKSEKTSRLAYAEKFIERKGLKDEYQKEVAKRERSV